MTNDNYYNPPIEIIITNTDYFFMIDNQVRDRMKDFETTICLPQAKSLLSKSNITTNELQDYPIEGYYYETDELKLYFTIIRNLNHNEKLWGRLDKKCEELDFLKSKCDNDIFGIEDPQKRNEKAPIKRRYDILTLTMENTSIFPDHNKVARPWSIDRIMGGLNTMYAGRPNLVELAYLTGDPKCLCCGAETNSLNRMIACVSGSYSCHSHKIEYIWEIDNIVEELGKKLVNEYNKLMEKTELISPTLKNDISNHTNFKSYPKLPRVSLLGYVDETKEYYHWILNEFNELKDIYDKEIITTETFSKKENSGYTGNIFNCKPVK